MKTPREQAKEMLMRAWGLPAGIAERVVAEAEETGIAIIPELGARALIRLDGAGEDVYALSGPDGDISSLAGALARYWQALAGACDEYRPSAIADEDGGGWALVLFLENPGNVISAWGQTFDEALDDLVEGLREYAEDWHDHLHAAPNHRRRKSLVQLIQISDGSQLRQWLARKRE
jgi:hypothetical protein